MVGPIGGPVGYGERTSNREAQHEQFALVGLRSCSGEGNGRGGMRARGVGAGCLAGGRVLTCQGAILTINEKLPVADADGASGRGGVEQDGIVW